MKIFLLRANTIKFAKDLTFLKVGILNTCFGYSIYACFIFLGFSYAASLFMATALGILFNYFTFGKFVFNQSVELLTLLKFIFAYGLVYLVNFIALWFLNKTTSVGPYLGQVICILPVVFLNWLLLNFWVYKKGLVL